MTIASAGLLTPIRFGSTPFAIKIVIGASTSTVGFSPVVGEDYYMSGDNSSTDLLKMLRDALDSATGSAFSICALTSTGKLHLFCGSGVGTSFSIKWTDAATTLDPTIFGFIEADTSSVSDLTSPNVVTGVWRPTTKGQGRPPSVDGKDRQTVTVAIGKSLSGLQRAARLALPKKERDLTFKLLDQSCVLSEDALSDAPWNTFEFAYSTTIGQGMPFLYVPDFATPTTFEGPYVLREVDAMKAYQRDDFNLMWRVEIPMRRT